MSILFEETVKYLKTWSCKARNNIFFISILFIQEQVRYPVIPRAHKLSKSLLLCASRR